MTLKVDREHREICFGGGDFYDQTHMGLGNREKDNEARVYCLGEREKKKSRSLSV